MTLEEELLQKGFRTNGPHDMQDLPEALGAVIRGHYGKTIEEIRIIQGKEARKDMKDYPNLYMIYTRRSEKVLSPFQKDN